MRTTIFSLVAIIFSVLLHSCQPDDEIIPETTSTSATELPSQGDYYVSASGSSNGDGTEASPFSTIQEAVDMASPGDIIIVQPGTYDETVTIQRSGAPGSPIRVIGQPGTIIETSVMPAIFHIQGSYIEVSGFEIRNSPTDDAGVIHVQRANHVTLRNNTIHNNILAAAYWLIETNNVTIDGGDLYDNRGGVRIDSTTNDLTIRNVNIFSTNIVLQQQGSTAESSQHFGILNGWEPHGGGNWLIENVTIRGTVTYGIELRSRSHTYPQENPTRNVIIRNCVLEQNGFGYAAEGWPNTDYPPEYYYGNVLIQGLDGVLVENSIFREGGDWGIDFYKTDNVIVRNCIFANNGMLTPHTEIGDGLEVNGGRNNKVYNNVIYGNSGGGLFLSYIIEFPGEFHSPTTVVANNILWNNGYDLAIVGPTEESPFQGHVARHDLFNNIYNTEDRWGPATETNSMVGTQFAPRFVDAENGNFQLQSDSPAIDAGWSGDADIPQSDFSGNPRPGGGAIDLGIFEMN